MAEVLSVEWSIAPEDERVEIGAELATAYWRETLGGAEPAYPVEELAFELTAAPGLVESRLALACDGDDVVGAALQRFPLNQRVSSWVAWLYVRPDSRRQGVGRALVAAAADAARGGGRHRLGWKTAGPCDPATSLSRSVGGVPDETLDHNRLNTADVDRSLLADWITWAAERASECSLVGWDGPCPAAFLDEFARLQAVMDDAPGAQPELVVTETAESIRARERRWLARGPYWRLCSRNDVTGELVGFTELQVPTTRPGIADQGDTAVRPDLRHRGIGRWLKAVNMLRLVETRPDVRFVDTINAADNTAMISINRAMGFRPVLAWTRWDLKL